MSARRSPVSVSVKGLSGIVPGSTLASNGIWRTASSLSPIRSITRRSSSAAVGALPSMFSSADEGLAPWVVARCTLDRIGRGDDHLDARLFG